MANDGEQPGGPRKDPRRPGTIERQREEPMLDPGPGKEIPEAPTKEPRKTDHEPKDDDEMGWTVGREVEIDDEIDDDYDDEDQVTGRVPSQREQA